jgi:hypothetical protein
MPHEAVIGPPLIIRDDHHDIGPRLSLNLPAGDV